MFSHAVWRAFLLAAMGIFLRSMSSAQTNFTFEDTLTQIGLGYPLLFLLGFRRRAGSGRAGRDPRWLLAGLGGLPAARRGLRLPGRRRTGRLAAPLPGLMAHWNKTPIPAAPSISGS